ncbi:hypothetical protein HDV03_003555 [Kappamyces sp. JEL0829]|nr:hypothetical protein HDV03_003555 [Kappamyces sp. JEL0829]
MLLGLSQVVGVGKLREKFKPFEAKRQLRASYDLFVADDRVLELLPRILGKTFFSKKNTVKAGYADMAIDDLHENLVQCIRGVVNKVPGKWSNIQSIHIKSSKSTALPVFNALPAHASEPADEEVEQESSQ